MDLPSVFLKQLQPLIDTSEMYNPLSLSIFLLILFYTLARLLKLIRRRSSKLTSPPSPPKLPILGNLHQLLRNLPHRSFKALSDRYGPLMFVYFGNSPSLVVSSAELASEVMKTHDIIFSNRPKTIAAHILLYECKDLGNVNYGEYWRQLRKICVLELLSTKRVQSAQHVRVKEVSELINKIRRSCKFKGRPINLSQMLLAISNNIASRCVFGRKVDDDGGGGANGEESNKFGELTRRQMMLMTSFCFGDIYPSLKWIDVLTGYIGRLHETANALSDLLDQVIEEHHRRLSKSEDDDDKKDFVHVLLQLQKDGNLPIELTHDTLKAILMDMFVGGTDTTATALEWVMAELMKNPGIMKRAQEEIRGVMKVNKMNIDMKDIEQMDYFKCVIKETLRLHAPVPLLVPRETAQSVKLRGYDIPAKTRVFVNGWAIQRDPKLWDMPEEFLPERFANNNPIDYNKGQDFQFIPFGGGRRGCPGMSFAMASIEYVMANLLYRFDWKLPIGVVLVEENLDMREAAGVTLQRKSPLLVVPTVYSPPP